MPPATTARRSASAPPARRSPTSQIGVEFPQNVPVVISVVAGPQFLFGATRIVNAPKPDPDPRADSLASIGFQPGEPARSGVINQASALSIERWRHLSYAKAAETGRDVIADHPTSRLDVSLTLDPGRAAHYGPTTVTGSRRVDPGFIAFMADLPEGKRFDPADIDAGQAAAEPARRLQLDPLRGGRRDPARRQPADDRARRGPQAAHHRLRRHASRPSTASASRPTGRTATSSAAPSACASTPASTASAARSTPTTTTTTSASPSPSPGSGRRTPTSSPR